MKTQKIHKKSDQAPLNPINVHMTCQLVISDIITLSRKQPMQEFLNTGWRFELYIKAKSEIISDGSKSIPR